MKRNIILGIVLLVLLIGTYFVQEYWQNQQRLEQHKKATIVDIELKDLTAIHLKNTHMVLEDEKFVVKKNLMHVDQRVLEMFLQKLGYLKVERIFTPDELSQVDTQNFFEEKPPFLTLKSKEKNITVTLGKKLPHSRSFYVKVTNQQQEKYLIGKNDSPQDKFYLKEEAETTNQDYLEMVSLFSIDDRFFYDKRFFLPEEEIKNIFIENTRNRSFYLKLDKQETTPKVIANLAYNTEFMQQYVEGLKSARSLDVIHPYFNEFHNLSEKVATIYFNLKAFSISLYRKYNDQNGYFVWGDTSPHLYEIGKDTVSFFFLNAQDFWDKRLFGRYSTFGNKEETFVMTFEDNRSFTITLPMTETLELRLDDVSFKTDVKITPNFETFRSLLNLLSGIGEIKQAQRVSPLNEESEDRMLKYPGLELKINDQRILIRHYKQEIYVVNLTHEYILHYLVGPQLPIKLKESDYFFFQDIN